MSGFHRMARRMAHPALVLLMAALWGGGAGRAQQAISAPEASAGKGHDASLDDYRVHLARLSVLTAACAKGRDLKTCDPTLIGPDDRVPVNAAQDALGSGKVERRTIRYGWLRVLFSRAEETDEARQAQGGGKKTAKPADEDDEEPASDENSARPAPKTTSQLLEDARDRLASDLKQAVSTMQAEPSHAPERAVLNKVLEGREFTRLKKRDTGPTLLERLGNWISSIFARLGGFQMHAAWVGRALTWGFVLAVGVGLMWWLLQLERRWRIRLVPESQRPAHDAPSARDWQLWLEDARKAAAAGAWRDAIHFLYWAAISRLEARRLWPADKARTPREYLALVAGDDPRRAGLGALTHTFERTWYGGRPAFESDYRGAEALATGLIEGGAPAVSGDDRR